MVKEHHVRVYKSEENLPREDQLAHKIAAVAADPVEVTGGGTEMVINRIIDNASVAVASLNRAPIVAAREPGGTSARRRLLRMLEERIAQTTRQIAALTRLRRDLERRRRLVARPQPQARGRGYCTCLQQRSR